MAAINDIEESTNETRGASSQSWITGDNSSEARSRSASKSASIAMTIDPSVLAMISCRDEESDDEDKRESDLCCGSCCDLVRAVIVTDIAAILLLSLSLIGSLLQLQIHLKLELYEEPMIDDDCGEWCSQQPQPITREGYFRIARVVFGIVGAFIGLVGAQLFQKYFVLCASVLNVIYAIWCVLDQYFVAPVVALFFLYPHVALILALHKGKITRENYAVTEKYCCWASKGTDSSRD